MEMKERPAVPIAEWPVEFKFKLQGRDLGHAGAAFAERIAADPCVARVTDVYRRRGDSMGVNAIVAASTHEEARKRSDDILHAARTAAGKTIPSGRRRPGGAATTASTFLWPSLSHVASRLIDVGKQAAAQGRQADCPGHGAT
jgi:hypothetical protein